MTEIKVPTPSALRLQMGEMTAAEVRTAQAAYRLGYLAAVQEHESAPRRYRDELIDAAGEGANTRVQADPEGVSAETSC